jgi:hypothetical protein
LKENKELKIKRKESAGNFFNLFICGNTVSRFSVYTGETMNLLKKFNLKKYAIILVIISFLFYGLIAVVPFLRITAAQKVLMVSVLVFLGEAAWWLGVAIIGKEVIMKYRKCLNPCKWFTCLTINHHKQKNT